MLDVWKNSKEAFMTLVIIFLFLFRVNFLGALPRVVPDFFFFNENLQLYTKVESISNAYVLT